MWKRQKRLRFRTCCERVEVSLHIWKNKKKRGDLTGKRLLWFYHVVLIWSVWDMGLDECLTFHLNKTLKRYFPQCCLLLLFLIYWLCWVFVAARGLSLVAASRGYSSLWCEGFSLLWLLLLRSTGSRRAGFSSCASRALERRLSSCGSRA